MALKLTGN